MLKVDRLPNLIQQTFGIQQRRCDDFVGSVVPVQIIGT